MNEYKKHEAKEESNRDLQLDDQLRKLEQEIRLVQPVSPNTKPDSMLNFVWSTAHCSDGVVEIPVDSNTTAPVEIANVPNSVARSRWIAAMAGSWLVGAIVGALAMWAVNAGGVVGAKASNMTDAQALSPFQLNKSIQIKIQTSRPLEAQNPVEIENRSQRNKTFSRYIDVEDVMGSTQLTVFNAKHIVGAAYFSNDHQDTSRFNQSEDGWFPSSQADDPAAPSTSNNLMKSLVF